MFKKDPLFLIDFYKAGHYAQYPNDADAQINTVEIFSNLTPRSSRTASNAIIWGGLQPVMMYLNRLWNDEFFSKNIDEICDKYQRFMDITLGKGKITTDHLRQLHKIGYLPLEIRALDEGTLTPMLVPVFTIRNTVGVAYWLVNYLETFLSSELWKFSTSATTSFMFRKNFEKFAKETGANKDFILWQGHDFSYRGDSGTNDAIMTGMAHLLSFRGTDTVPAVIAIEDVYGDSWENTFLAGSVAATEHSVMCSNIGRLEKKLVDFDEYGKIKGGIKAGEYQEIIEKYDIADWSLNRKSEFITFLWLISELYPTGICSIVSDSFDYWSVINDILPRLKDVISSRDGRVVIRPDSGDPVDIICGTALIDGLYEDEESAREHFYDITHDSAVADLGSDGEICGLTTYVYYTRIKNELYKVTCDVNTCREHGALSDNDYYVVDGIEVNFEKHALTCEEAGTFELLYDIFGGTVNEKGYKVLDPHIGIIYGDSITLARQIEILQKLKYKKFTADNLVLGIGSYSFQYVTRDTYGFAMKATNAIVNEAGTDVSYEICKDPKTNVGAFVKKSARGYLKVVDENGTLTLKDNITFDDMNGDDNMLKVVFLDGKLTKFQTFTDIRNKVESYL